MFVIVKTVALGGVILRSDRRMALRRFVLLFERLLTVCDCRGDVLTVEPSTLMFIPS